MSIENELELGRPNECMVTLIDGRQVSNYSEEWRHECEARTICLMPNKQARRNFLRGYTKPDGKKFRGILGTRGESEVKRLEATIKAIWVAEFKPKPEVQQSNEPREEPRTQKGLL